MRTFGIWICGILASAILGGFAGSVLDRGTFSSDHAVWGVLGGMLIFACLRLWLAAPAKK